VKAWDAFTVGSNQSRSLSFLFRRAGLHPGIATREFFDPSCGVDKLLLPGEEWMARRANTDLDITPRRPRVIRGTARAVNRCLVVFGVNICFHGRKREVDSNRVASDGK